MCSLLLCFFHDKSSRRGLFFHFKHGPGPHQQTCPRIVPLARSDFVAPNTLAQEANGTETWARARARGALHPPLYTFNDEFIFMCSFKILWLMILLFVLFQIVNLIMEAYITLVDNIFS
jgi:hypothetical protein